MSRNSYHVQPSRRGADFFGMLVKAYDIALSGIGKNGDLYVDGGAGTWEWSVDLVSFARKVAATTRSDSDP